MAGVAPAAYVDGIIDVATTPVYVYAAPAYVAAPSISAPAQQCVVFTVAVRVVPSAPFTARFELHVTVNEALVLTAASTTIVRTPLDTLDDLCATAVPL